MAYQVTFTSTPSGANVYLGGWLGGKTPVTLSGLSGNYVVSIKLSGYPDFNTSISPGDAGKTIHADFSAPPGRVPGVTVAAHGVGTGQSNGYVSGAKNTFSSGETVYAAYRISDDLGGKTSVIKWLRKENGSWNVKASLSSTFKSGFNWGWHQSNWHDMGDGEWKINFIFDGVVLASDYFTYGALAPPPAPPVVPIPPPVAPTPRKIKGHVYQELTTTIF